MITPRKKKSMNQIMGNKYNGILNILGIRKKKKKKKGKKRKEGKGEEQNERIVSSAIFCDIMELKYFVKIGRNWNSPQLRPRQGNLYCRNLCNSRGATRTSRCKLPSPGEYRKVNGILSSAYAEKFYASVSAFTFAMLLHQAQRKGKLAWYKIVLFFLTGKRAVIVKFVCVRKGNFLRFFCSAQLLCRLTLRTMWPWLSIYQQH